EALSLLNLQRSRRESRVLGQSCFASCIRVHERATRKAQGLATRKYKRRRKWNEFHQPGETHSATFCGDFGTRAVSHANARLVSPSRPARTPPTVLGTLFPSRGFFAVQA